MGSPVTGGYGSSIHSDLKESVGNYFVSVKLNQKNFCSFSVGVVFAFLPLWVKSLFIHLFI